MYIHRIILWDRECGNMSERKEYYIQYYNGFEDVPVTECVMAYNADDAKKTFMRQHDYEKWSICIIGVFWE